MRLIWTSENINAVHKYISLLSEEKIEYTLSPATDTDWESTSYGSTLLSIWIHNDDDSTQAQSLLKNMVYTLEKASPTQIQGPSLLEEFVQHKFHISSPKKPLSSSKSIWTTIIIFCCLIIFFLDIHTSSQNTSSPIRNALLIDAPSTNNTWNGAYTQLIALLRQKETISIDQMFTSILDGKLWRLITPIFLHNDPIHVLFTMMWLLFLSPQIERRYKFGKYSLLILISAIFSNIAQYICTGPNFLGFSGIICAMVGFIHSRQQAAPWQGYDLPPTTYNFVCFFIWGLLAFAFATFFFEWYTHIELKIGFANMSHIVGLFTGKWLGSLSLFKENKQLQYCTYKYFDT